MDPIVLIGALSCAVVTIGLSATAMSCFKRCPPNQAMIISGMGSALHGEEMTIVLNGGAIVMPVVQQCSFISLSPINVPLSPSQDPVTSDGVAVKIRATATVSVGKTNSDVAAAATCLLGKTTEEMVELCTNIFESRIHEAASEMLFSTMSNRLHDTGTRIGDLATEDLKGMGLVIVSVTVKEVQRLIPNMVANA